MLISLITLHWNLETYPLYIEGLQCRIDGGQRVHANDVVSFSKRM